MEVRDGRGSRDATQHDAERVRDETSGIGPGLSGCRDGVGTGVERVITGYLFVPKLTPGLLGFLSARYLCTGDLFAQVFSWINPQVTC